MQSKLMRRKWQKTYSPIVDKRDMILTAINSGKKYYSGISELYFAGGKVYDIDIRPHKTTKKLNPLLN